MSFFLVLSLVFVPRQDIAEMFRSVDDSGAHLLGLALERLANGVIVEFLVGEVVLAIWDIDALAAAGRADVWTMVLLQGSWLVYKERQRQTRGARK